MLHNILYLWSYVVRSATKCLSGGTIENPLFTHAKVGNLDVAILIEEDIVQLEVTINNPMGVEKEQANSNFRRIKPKD